MSQTTYAADPPSPSISATKSLGASSCGHDHLGAFPRGNSCCDEVDATAGTGDEDELLIEWLELRLHEKIFLMLG